MSFVSFPVIACRTLLVLLSGVAPLALAGGSGYAADYKRIAVLSSPKPMVETPSGAELVGRLLDERSTGSDPDIPLPQRNLATPQPAYVPLNGPQIYGRRDEGSVVVGLKIPIPADRGAVQ
jgi:hypothetical protein